MPTAKPYAHLASFSPKSPLFPSPSLCFPLQTDYPSPLLPLLPLTHPFFLPSAPTPPHPFPAFPLPPPPLNSPFYHINDVLPPPTPSQPHLPSPSSTPPSRLKLHPSPFRPPTALCRSYVTEEVRQDRKRTTPSNTGTFSPSSPPSTHIPPELIIPPTTPWI